MPLPPRISRHCRAMSSDFPHEFLLIKEIISDVALKKKEVPEDPLKSVRPTGTQLPTGGPDNKEDHWNVQNGTAKVNHDEGIEECLPALVF